MINVILKHLIIFCVHGQCHGNEIFLLPFVGKYFYNIHSLVPLIKRKTMNFDAIECLKNRIGNN